MKRKVLVVIMTMLMVMTMLPGMVFAEDAEVVDPVAKIGDKGYATLQEAINDATDGDIIVLQKDITSTSTGTAVGIVRNAQSGITIDLNNKTISGIEKYVIITSLATDVVIKNGTIKSMSQTAKNYAVVTQGGDITVENVNIIVNAPDVEAYNYAAAIMAFDGQSNVEYLTANGTFNNVTVKENKSSTAKGFTVGVVAQGAYSSESGKTDTSVTVNLNNCDINVNGFAACGNGNAHGTAINVKDSNLTSSNSAIYHPQYGKLAIDNSTVTGGTTGIEMRSGELIVNSGTIVGNGTPLESAANGSGTTILGAAVAVSQHTTEKPIKVTLNGGTFVGEHSIFEVDTEKNQTEYSKNVSIGINGGTYKGKVESLNNKLIISGGLFSTNPDTGYIADGYISKVTSVEGETMYEITEPSVTPDESITPSEDGDGIGAVVIDPTSDLKPSVSENSKASIKDAAKDAADAFKDPSNINDIAGFVTEDNAALVESVSELIGNDSDTVKVTIVPNVEVLTEPSDAMDEALDNNAKNDEKLICTVDVNLDMIVTVYDNNGNAKGSVSSKISDLPEGTVLEITLKLDEILAGKDVRIIHMHGDDVEIIEDVTVNENTNEVTFKMTKFSELAFLVSDGSTVETTTPSTPAAGTTTPATDNTVQTSDDFNMTIPFALAGLALAGMAVAVVARKRHN